MIIINESLTERQKNDVWELIKASDTEFVPPLSSRVDTTQTDLHGKSEKKEPTEYFESLLEQSFVLSVEDGRVIGFLSFRPDHRLKNEHGLDLICNYVSTIIVAKDQRRKGYTENMYRALIRSTRGKTIATRTWSQNTAHILLLEKLGFELLMRIPDDRGEGIDTVYYAKGE